jgi:hypothetical protein
MINLTIAFGMPAGAVSNLVRYARIDNLAPGASPVYTQVTPNPVTSPATIATNIPDGQYTIQSTPVYPDGRTCTPTVYTTPACPGLTSISATIQSGVLVVTYLAPAGVTNVIITVGYPNGGSFQQMYVNTGNPISIALPAGVYGNYSVNGQSVCDPTSGFYSAPSSTVTVAFGQPISGTYYLGNTLGGVCAAGPTTLYSAGVPIPGSILYQDEAMTTPVVGYSLVMYQGIIYNLSSTQGILGADSGQSCTPTVLARNALSFLTFSAITGIPGFTYTPVSGSFSQSGSHSAFTGAISVTVSGTVPGSPSFSITLYQNGVAIDCIPYVAGTYINQILTFGSFTFLETDIISIDSGTGGCP